MRVSEMVARFATDAAEIFALKGWEWPGRGIGIPGSAEIENTAYTLVNAVDDYLRDNPEKDHATASTGRVVVTAARKRNVFPGAMDREYRITLDIS